MTIARYPKRTLDREEDRDAARFGGSLNDYTGACAAPLDAQSIDDQLGHHPSFASAPENHAPHIRMEVGGEVRFERRKGSGGQCTVPLKGWARRQIVSLSLRAYRDRNHS